MCQFWTFICVWCPKPHSCLGSKTLVLQAKFRRGSKGDAHSLPTLCFYGLGPGKVQRIGYHPYPQYESILLWNFFTCEPEKFKFLCAMLEKDFPRTSNSFWLCFGWKCPWISRIHSLSKNLLFQKPPISHLEALILLTCVTSRLQINPHLHYKEDLFFVLWKKSLYECPFSSWVSEPFSLSFLPWTATKLKRVRYLA